MTKSRSLGMRLLSLALCVVCILCLVPPVKATEAVQKPTTLTTVVRNGGYDKASVIGQLENGTPVTVLDVCGDYYRIDCYDMNGYVARSQISQKEDETYYVNCLEDSTETCSFTYETYTDALQLRFGLYELAHQQLGKPYIYGSTGMRGFDCSGLMYYLFGSYGIQLQRRASEQLQDGIVVSREGMQVGDMVFFHESWDSCPASHVGIYIGNNKIIHASTSNGIEIADLDARYYANNFLCVRRVIQTQAAQLEAQTPEVEPRAIASGRRAS